MQKMKLRIVIGIVLFILIDSICLVSALPDYFDWRNKDGENWITSIKDQGSCGSCWAHNTLGTFEAQSNIALDDANYDKDLSEEYLVADCYSSGSCCGISGTDLGGVLAYIKNNGVPDEECMEYSESCSCSSGTCDANCNYDTSQFSNCSDFICSDRCPDWEGKIQKIDDYESISNNKEAIKTYLYETGPVAVVMYWDGVQDFNANIFTCNPDSGAGNHAVIIIGYNETGDYWIVKNSHGSTWGPYDNGYFYVGFDECSIEDHAYGVNVGTIKKLTVSNTGDADLSVTSITDNRAWITSISPTSFTVSPSSSEDVTVKINPDGYSPGTYSGTITINNNDPDENPKTVSVTMNIYCIDNDGDGYNDYDATWCDSGTDCDDTNGNIHPGATEICDNVDNNCASGTDEGCDDDNDNYCDDAMSCSGSPSTCSAGYCSSLDCDDTDENIHPGATEDCDNGEDDDCDGDTDCDDSDCSSDPACETCTQNSDCAAGEYCTQAQTCASDLATGYECGDDITYLNTDAENNGACSSGYCRTTINGNDNDKYCAADSNDCVDYDGSIPAASRNNGYQACEAGQDSDWVCSNGAWSGANPCPDASCSNDIEYGDSTCSE